MFCNQCEETARGCACTARGVCGKDPETAGLQDVLIWVCRGLAARNIAATGGGKGNPEVGLFIAGALFGTLTNVDFDPDRIRRLIREAVALRDLLPPAGPDEPAANAWAPADDAAIRAKADEIAADAAIDDDVHSLRTLLLAGLKGLAAYYYHAATLGYTDETVTAFLERALAADLRDLPADELVGLAMECGSVGVTTLALLDKANTETFGHPAITTVRTTVGDRPGILVTGHELGDLKQLLDQTRDSGIDIYTHGEMLPAHAYPAFRGYPQLVGNYGGAWWKQADEFARFNGPVLVTTNCIVPPREAYRDRIFTTGPAGYPGVPHIGMARDGTKDFSPLIEVAKRSPPPEPLPGSGRELTTGCAHQAVDAIAGSVVDAIKSGAIRRFVVMAGCDGRQPEREYYTEFAQALPQDTVILTAGCAKYRYNALDLGTAGGIPRVIDAGQCNDSYSLVAIAQQLANAFGVGINDLPISYNIAWYEQKAVLVLLALLSVGVKDITLGPRLPGFLSPGVLDVLVREFGLKRIATVGEDLARMVPSAAGG
ncbi:MAG: hydroxylamine reductase [Methanospirillum sp.]